jgi:hypothetical protein
VQQEHVARPSAFAATGSIRRWRVLLHRELKKLALGRSPQSTRDPGIQEPNDGPQHLIRSGGKATMQPENSPAKTQHYGPVGVGDNSINLSQPELVQSDRKLIVQKE